jgi:hypothetical protein
MKKEKKGESGSLKFRRDRSEERREKTNQPFFKREYILRERKRERISHSFISYHFWGSRTPTRQTLPDGKEGRRRREDLSASENISTRDARLLKGQGEHGLTKRGQREGERSADAKRKKPLHARATTTRICPPSTAGITPRTNLLRNGRKGFPFFLCFLFSSFSFFLVRITSCGKSP